MSAFGTKNDCSVRARPVRLRENPTGRARREVVAKVLVVGKGERTTDGPNVLGQQRSPLVVETPPIRLDVVEPHVVRAARVGAGEEEDGGGDTGIRAERPRGKLDDSVELSWSSTSRLRSVL